MQLSQSSVLTVFPKAAGSVIASEGIVRRQIGA